MSVEPPTSDDETGQGPAVGNVLGFSLLFRERRALLALVRRTLVPGVRLREFEALIPGVRMPLRGPLTATKFRHHRCRVVRASLVVEDRALSPWLSERLVAQDVAGVRITGAELEFRPGEAAGREAGSGAEALRPWLIVRGRSVAGSEVWLGVGLDLEIDRRWLRLSPCRLWLIGDAGELSAASLWQAIALRLVGGNIGGLRGGAVAREDGSISVDAGRLGLTRSFASVGWKAPNFEGTAITELQLTRRALTIELRGPLTEFEPGEAGELDSRSRAADEFPVAGASPGAANKGRATDPVARTLDRLGQAARLAVEFASLQPILHELDSLSHELRGFAAARLALIRWRIELARFRDRDAALAAVQEWLEIQPSAPDARRLLGQLLAATGRSQELARLIAAECRLPHPTGVQARLELAVATLLIDRLDDPRSALAIVGPLAQRLREQPPTERRGPGGLRSSGRGSTDEFEAGDALPEALVVLARARLAELSARAGRPTRSLTSVPHVLAALDEALQHTPVAARRADFRVRLARSFVEYGGGAQALALLTAAIADTPDDVSLLDQAIELAEAGADWPLAISLLRARLDHAQPPERPQLRKRLIVAASRLDDRPHLELARAELAIAIDHDGGDPELFRCGAAIERRLGDPFEAANHLGRLLDLDAFGEIQLDDRPALMVERARLLRRAGRIDEAWECLRAVVNAIAGAASAADPGVLDVIELGLELAPPTDRPMVLDLVVHHARGQRRGEALVERAAQSLHVSDRVDDLWAAVNELERPGKALAQIEQLVEDDDVVQLGRLAAAASQCGEPTTEFHGRARLGRAFLVRGEPAYAAVELERALALEPDHLELRAALADCHELLDQPQAALPHLRLLLERSDASPVESARVTLRVARILRESVPTSDSDAAREAASLLATCERELAAFDPELVDVDTRETVAERAFSALCELGDEIAGLQVAVRQVRWASDRTDDARLAGWLSRVAGVLTSTRRDTLDTELMAEWPVSAPSDRIGLIERAVAIRPHDPGLADQFEALLRERGDRPALERHLRQQIQQPDLAGSGPRVEGRRIDLLQRLIAVLDSDPADRVRESIEALEQLVALRPDDESALVRLGELHLAGGEHDRARTFWLAATAQLADDDPRLIRPALELGRHALELGDPERARSWAETARRLAPTNIEMFDLLNAIAAATRDPRLLAEVATSKLAGAPDDGVVRSELEYARACALADVFERDLDHPSAHEALDGFARAERLAPANARTLEREPANRTWLRLAESVSDFAAEARARAVLRETPGGGSSLSDLLAEVQLLAGPLDRPTRALELLEARLAVRPIEPALIEALADFVAARQAGEWVDVASRVARGLRTALADRERSPGRSAAATLAVELGHELDHPAIVAFALDQLDPEEVEHGELAELRDWAIRRLGRVPEELALLESRLLTRLPPTRRDRVVARVLGLRDGDRLATVARLISLADHADREPALGLAEAGFAMIEPASIEAGLDCLAILARHGARDRLLEHWPAIEAIVLGSTPVSGTSPAFERLMALAGELESGPAKVRAERLLGDRLVANPRNPGLVRALWQRSNQLLGSTVSWIDTLTQDRRLGVVTTADLIEGLADQVGIDDNSLGLAFLRDQTEARLADPPLFDELFGRLEVRHAWDEMLGVLTKANERGLEVGTRVDVWLRTAESAATDRDLASEARARGRAAQILIRSSGLDLPGAIDLALAIRAIAELRRTLQLAPQRADIRWRLGRSLARVHEFEPSAALANEALAILLPLWDEQRWSDAGVEAAELSLRCGELALELGDHERAAQLLAAAHSRLAPASREHSADRLFAVLVSLSRTHEAVELAASRAAELVDVDRQVAWLRRGAEIADDLGQVELLSHAHELAPDLDSLASDLGQLLTRLGDIAALEQLAHERLDRVRGRARSESGLDLDAIDPARLSPTIRAAWIASLRARVALVRSPEPGARPVDSDEHDRNARLDVLVPLHRELLRLEPDDAEALLTLAAQHQRSGDTPRAIAMWQRAEPLLRADDPRLSEVAKRLAEHRLASAGDPPTREDLLAAHRLLERALAVRPDDPSALARRHAIACRLDDSSLVLAAARGMLDHPTGIHVGQVAGLTGDVARALALLGRPLEALTAYERAVGASEPGSEIHRELAGRWLELVQHPQLADADPTTRAARELAARTQVRLASGQFDRDTLREVELLIELGGLEPALTLLENLLIHLYGRSLDAEAAALLSSARARLDRLASGDSGRHRDRVLRSLRRIVDALPAGPTRDELARELARLARNAEAARTTLDALDRLSGHAAAEPDLLELRVWAVRKLDRVEDELADLDRMLGLDTAPEDESLIDRLLAILDHDVEACAARLISRSGAPDPSAHVGLRMWLLESALEILGDHAPDRIALGVQALGDVLELIGDPAIAIELDADEQGARERVAESSRQWRAFAVAAIEQANQDPRAFDSIVELVRQADRADASELPGFSELGETLLTRANLDHPDHPGLHALARQRLPGDETRLAVERIDRLATEQRLEPPVRARLHIGLAATLESADQRTLLRELAGRERSDSIAFGVLREALRKIGAFAELTELVELGDRDAESDQWIELATDAASADRPDVEGEARHRAGMLLLTRVSADEQDAGALTEGILRQAVEQLERAHRLLPADVQIQLDLGLGLERAGQAAAALARLEPLIGLMRTGRDPRLAALARRCGMLAIETGARPRAVELLELARSELVGDKTQLAVCERLFRLLVELGRTDEATNLARDTAKGLDGDESVPWLVRAARLAPDAGERMGLYSRAHALRPDDDHIADAYEASLATDNPALVALLRARIGQARPGDRAETVTRIDRLLELLPAETGDGERTELIELLLRLAPDRSEARLELASRRWLEGDREAAASHWRRVAPLLADDDSRFAQPALELARISLDAEDHVGARQWFERALAIDPRQPVALLGLVDLAERSGDANLVLSASEPLLDQAGPASERLGVLRRRAGAFEQVGRIDDAIAALRQATAHVEPESTEYVEISEQWLRLATQPGGLDEQSSAQEAEARAALRSALGARLPARMWIAEAELYAARLGQPDRALALLRDALMLHSDDPGVLVAFEQLCPSGDEQVGLVAVLSEVLRQQLEAGQRPTRMIEKLARMAHAIGDPQACMSAIEAMPSELAERPESVELRNWAIRGLGRVDAELADIDGRLTTIELDPPDALQALVGRMSGLLGDRGACVERLLALAGSAGLDPERARVLTRTALRVAREHAPDQLDIAIKALRATLEHDSVSALAIWWPGIESLALDSRDIRAIVDLLRVSQLAEREGGLAYRSRTERLMFAAAAIDPGDTELHDAVVDGIAWSNPELPELVAGCRDRYDELARELGLQGGELARLWQAGLASLERRFGANLRTPPTSELIADMLKANAERWIADPEAVAGTLASMRELGRLGDLLDSTLRISQRSSDVPIEVFEDIADRAEHAGDTDTQLRARVELGTRLAAFGDFEQAVVALTAARSLAPGRVDVQLALGIALHEIDRLDEALEQLLPLTESRSLGEDASGSLLDPTDLASRVAAILIRADRPEQAAELVERALSGATVEQAGSLADQLFDSFIGLGWTDRAAGLAHARARASAGEPDNEVRWLLRVAEHSQGELHFVALSRAHDLRPDDDALRDRHERLLEDRGEVDRLAGLLRTRVDQARARLAVEPGDDRARASGAAALRRLIDLTTDPSVKIDFLEGSLDFTPNDTDVLLTLAALRDDQVRPEAAATLWRRVGALLPPGDDRFYQPALRLAEVAIRERELDDARALLERAMGIRPGDREALSRLSALAALTDDPGLTIRTLTALLDHGDLDRDAGELELELARAHASLAGSFEPNSADASDSSIAAFDIFERAAARAAPGSQRHTAVARAELEFATQRREALDTSGHAATDAARHAALEREASALARVRTSLGAEVGVAELRAEARVLVRLERSEEALALLERALANQPHDQILLSIYKDFALAAGLPVRYADVLESAIAGLGRDEADTRDQLATELAFTAVELDDASRLLGQLERMSPARAGSPELLDLREWAIRKLGRVEHELGAIDRELLVAIGDETEPLVARLLRMLDHDYTATAERLLALSRTADPGVGRALRVAMLELASMASPAAIEPLLAAAAKLVHENPPATELLDHWPALEQLALAHGRAWALANLIDVGRQAVARGRAEQFGKDDGSAERSRHRQTDSEREAGATATGLAEREQREAPSRRAELASQVDALQDLALSNHPDSPELLSLYWGSLTAEPDREARLARADTLLDDLARRLDADPVGRARLAIGLAQLFERREGAELLVRRGRRAVDDPAAFGALLDTLQQRSHWTRAVELLGFRAEQVDDEDRRVADLKQLAHLYAEVLGDPDMAIIQLERALALAPDDPDLMLPLLDHYYGQPKLDQAIELSLRVLDHVPMGGAAFAALGHRAADAALASGRHEFSEKLLRRILARVPDEPRTRDRLRELEGLADDPEHRVRMLAAIANRTSGSARVEALEERARLLVEPLGRHEEAIADLEAVAGEARGGIDLLASLYELRQRWPALVALLSREYPRQQGIERIRTLQRIARLYRTRLADLPQAEQAFRLALDNLDDLSFDADQPDSADLAESLRLVDRLADELHLELVTVLDQQGRFSDLIVHLERELAEDVDGRSDPRERGADRVVLMQALARALREHAEDSERTARCYARLEQLDALPDEGLATLARWYRTHQRYDDLVRILTLRSRKLAEIGDADRKAEADFRIGELLEGPLRRPQEAARFFLDAYLSNPADNPSAGTRARVLLAGTDSVANVRNRLLTRLGDLREAFKPALLTLLGDLLAPHDDYETEAERRYREAIAITATLAPAHEGLGRLLARQGRIDEAIAHLALAADSPDIPNDRAADDAASAARALIELERMPEAEAVLQRALARAPDSQRALLELARLYDRTGRSTEQAGVLERLAKLSLSSMLRAEVCFRQAMLLALDFRADPMSAAGERARGLLLEAVGAHAMHAQARHTLLELATARNDWSIVAHMHFLAIRELPPGPRRALTHLDLAETYLDRLGDAPSATRNLAAAVQHAPLDIVVLQRATALSLRLPSLPDAAEKLAQFARSPASTELGETFTEPARARLMLLASDLHLRSDALEAAESAALAATEFRDLPEGLRQQAEQQLEQIVHIDQGEFDLRKRRKALVAKLDQATGTLDRLHLLARLREAARALGDRAELEDTTSQVFELANGLLGGPDPGLRDAAIACLRDLFAEAGEYGRIVALYEDLADRTPVPDEAAERLTAAARFAWSGQRDPKLAVALIRRALDRAPTHAPATALLGEIAGASDEREVDATICDELSLLSPRQRPPLLTLRLAEAALRLERREQAQGVLRQLLAGEASVELRLQALSLLDGLLESAARTHDRVPLLEERLELSRRHWPDRAADVALELARAQRAIGNLQDARATCRTALLDKPSDQPLTKLYAELLEQAEDWSALARALEQLANLTIETGEQAHWLTRAAQVHLDHGTDGRDALPAARRLLERARVVSMESAEARAILLPLAFHQGDWERVIDLAIELRAIAGDQHEALLYAALTEAFARGQRTLARSIGPRHDRSVRNRIVWPTLARMLDLIAMDGPLPRLDAVLAAAAALCSGTEELLTEFGAWAAGQPQRPGLALGLARVNEAFRRMDIARHLYQISGYLAPSGPVPVLTTRFPAAELPRDPLARPDWVPLEWRGALREVLIRLRGELSGIRGERGNVRPPRTAAEAAAIELGNQISAPWRDCLGLTLTLLATDDHPPGGVALRNLERPTLVISEEFVGMPEAERAYRLAYAAGALATGLGAIVDDHPVAVVDMIDVLMGMARPRHVPRSEGAHALADQFAARGLTGAKLDVDLRRTLARELDHWQVSPAKLERVVHRACMLIGARLSGHVDGALMAIARDRGLSTTQTGRPMDPAALSTPDGAWLLRTLGAVGPAE